jgi:hypothetical protein
MTDGGAFEVDQGEPTLPFRPRGAYIGHQVFGDGDSAVLIDPEVARDLRSAAESARQERRIAAGLLYGRGWTDDEGDYLVVDGFLEAGPGENPRDRSGDEEFTLSEADLRLLRQDAERMYSAAVEVGWWRSQLAGGGFDSADFRTQAELVPPGGVGLLVYESGRAWGAAYLDPDGHEPSTAGRLAAVPGSESETLPDRAPEPVAATVPTTQGPTTPVPSAPGPAGGAGTGAAPARWPGAPTLTPPPQPAGPRVISPVRVPSRELGVGVGDPNPSPVGERMPTDVKLVVGALVVVAIVAAIMVGVLVSNALVAVIVAVVGLAALLGFVVMSRL